MTTAMDQCSPPPPDYLAVAVAGYLSTAPYTTSGDTTERAQKMIAKGLTVREAAIRLKIGKTALYEAQRRHTSVNAKSRKLSKSSVSVSSPPT